MIVWQQRIEEFVLSALTPAEGNWANYAKFPRFVNFEKHEKKLIERELGVNLEMDRVIKVFVILDLRKQFSGIKLLDSLCFSI
jgi:hypothetical protein